VFNTIRAGAPATHIMVLTPPGISDYGYGTGLGNAAQSFANLPGAVDWSITSVAYHLYSDDGNIFTNAQNLCNFHSRFPGWPSENNFPPSVSNAALGITDAGRSQSFGSDVYVNQTCERLGLGWSMWNINGQTQLDQNWPILWADAVAKGYRWNPDPVTAPATLPSGGIFTAPLSVSLSTPTLGASIRYTTDGTTPTATNGTLYTGNPIKLTAATTLKAIAYLAGMTNSATVTASYTVLPGQPAKIQNASLIGTNLVFIGTNLNGGTNFHFLVLIATNLSTPLTNWTVVSTNSFQANGTFGCTNGVSSTRPAAFFQTKAVP